MILKKVSLSLLLATIGSASEPSGTGPQLNWNFNATVDMWVCPDGMETCNVPECNKFDQSECDMFTKMGRVSFSMDQQAIHQSTPSESSEAYSSEKWWKKKKFLTQTQYCTNATSIYDDVPAAEANFWWQEEFFESSRCYVVPQTLNGIRTFYGNDAKEDCAEALLLSWMPLQFAPKFVKGGNALQVLKNASMIANEDGNEGWSAYEEIDGYGFTVEALVEDNVLLFMSAHVNKTDSFYVTAAAIRLSDVQPLDADIDVLPADQFCVDATRPSSNNGSDWVRDSNQGICYEQSNQTACEKVGCCAWFQGICHPANGLLDVCYPPEPHNQDQADKLNAMNHSWVAGAYEAWEGMTLDDLKHLSGVRSEFLRWLPSTYSPNGTDFAVRPLRKDNADEDFEFRAAVFELPDGSLPDTFDPREHWSECKDSFKIMNQGFCGSCWAFAATTAFKDRICIASGGEDLIESFSEQEMVDCTWTTTGGCTGGFIDEAHYYLLRHGLGSDQCAEYEYCAVPEYVNCEAPNSTPGPTSRSPNYNENEEPLVYTQKRAEACFEAQWLTGRQCRQSIRKYSEVYPVGDPSMTDAERVRAIQEELYLRGPVETVFFVYNDFKFYQSGVYSRTKGSYRTGAHAVKIIGWGTSEEGEDYWLVANSWSPQWGEDGYFKIRRGVNECGIEYRVAAGKYQVDTVTLEGEPSTEKETPAPVVPETVCNAPRKRGCDKMEGCEWRDGECSATVVCEGDRKTCNAITGCRYNRAEKTCVKDAIPSTCADVTISSVCRKMPECTWTGASKKGLCINSSDVQPDCAKNGKNPKKCKAIEGCQWMKKSKSCVLAQ